MNKKIISLMAALLTLSHNMCFAAESAENRSNQVQMDLSQITNPVDIAIDTHRKLTYVSFSSDSESIEKGVIYVLNSQNQQIVDQIKIENATQELKIKINPKGQLYALSLSESEYRVFRITSIRVAASWKFEQQEVPIAIDKDHQVIDMVVREDEALDLIVAQKDDINQVSLVNIVPSKDGKIQSFSERNLKTTKQVVDQIVQEGSPNNPVKKQDETNYAKLSQGMAAGFSAGLTTGLGFAVRKFNENGNGFHVGAAIVSTDGNIDFNIGTEYLKALKVGENTRFYALSGLSTFYSESTETIASQPSDAKDVNSVDYATRKTSSASYNIGAGLGIEWVLGGWAKKGLSVAIEGTENFSFIKNEDQDLKKEFRFSPSFIIIHYF